MDMLVYRVFVGDFVPRINHDIRIPTKQPIFHGK